LGLTRFDGHPKSGRHPGKDVHHGDHGKDEAPLRSFSKQFKTEVVDLVRQPGNTPASVARDLDLTESAVRGWVRQAEIDGGGRDGLTSAEWEELSRLRKENRVLREERDILKGATAFFARETR
jgi:transposase